MNYSTYLCIDQLDSLTTVPKQFSMVPEVSQNSYTPVYSPSEPVPLKLSVKTGSKSHSMIDAQLSRNLNDGVKNVKVTPDALRRSDPFYKLSDRYSLDTLAMNCIDTVYDVVNGPFLALCEGPGGWVKYIQKKLPSTRGYGVSLPTYSTWDFPGLDVVSFKILYGGGGTGNVINERDWLIDYVGKEPPVTLVTSDESDPITIASSAIIGLSLLQKQERKEFLVDQTQPRTIEELQAGVPPPNALKTAVLPGGNLVFRFEDTSDRLTIDIIYLITRCFTECYLYKPCVAPAHKFTRYLVCKNYIGDNGSIDGLKLVDRNVVSVVDSKIPDNFTKWLTHCNNQLGNRQLEMLVELSKYPHSVAVIGRDLSRLLYGINAVGSTTTDLF